jgi:hypothetical protein
MLAQGMSPWSHRRTKAEEDSPSRGATDEKTNAYLLFSDEGVEVRNLSDLRIVSRTASVSISGSNSNTIDRSPPQLMSVFSPSDIPRDVLPTSNPCARSRGVGALYSRKG